MNRPVRIILVAFIAGLGAFFVTRQLASPSANEGELDWLTAEFQLSPLQAVEVRTLHDAYRPVCVAHCTSIMELRQQIEASPSSGAQTQAKLQTVIATCHDTTQAHLEAVAAVMDPEQGKRYLALIGPRLSVHQHAEPFGLR